MDNSNFNNLQEFVGKIVHALDRPIVQSQLFLILLIVAVVWFINYSLLKGWYQKFPHMKKYQLNTYPPSIQCYATAFLLYLSSPILCLMGVIGGKFILDLWDWYSGLFDVAIDILWFFVCFRLFLTICYSFFTLKTVDRYRYRFFLPVFMIYVIYTILSLLFYVQRLSQVNIIKLFDSNLSLGAIFVITIGIYLWVMGVSIVEQLFLALNRLMNKAPGIAKNP